MNISYRKFQESDKKIITVLIQSLYKEDPGYKEITIEKIDKTFNELLKYPEKGKIIVIQDCSNIIGYSILINFWSNEYGGNILDIDELYIKPDYRDKGIGANFIKYLIDSKFSNSGAIKLEASPSNNKAKKLYEHIGFKESQNNHFIFDLKRNN